MRIATEPMLADQASLLDASRPRGEGLQVDPALLADPISGPSLRYYVLLTARPDLVSALGLSNEELFASRYYWFRRHVALQAATRGLDFGLAHQAIQLLESAAWVCEPDWQALEDVEAQAVADAEEQLADLVDDPFSG